MPYITQDKRKAVDAAGAISVGELTYALYSNCINYLNGSKKRFADYAEVIAALEMCKLEFYLRHVVPYEDEKLAQNGNVT